MAENNEKQCFAFFAFLPPYIGVSCSLVSRKRKSVKRSIDWYQRFLISCFFGRYRAVLVFYMGGRSILDRSLTWPWISMEIHGNPEGNLAGAESG